MRNCFLRAARGAVLLLAALGACSSIGGAPVGQVATLVLEGGEKRLRDPMRPLRGGTRVLVFAFDGVGEEVLAGAVAGGRMPNVAGVLGAPSGPAGVYAHAYSVPDVLSVIPSVTAPAWTTLFTGKPPAETGVPGNEWFARDEMRFYAPVPVSVESREHAARMYTEGLVGRAVRTPTLFEEAGVRSHVALLPMHRGADLLHLPKLGTFGDLFFEAVRSAARGRPTEKSYSELDQNVVRSVVAGLKEHGAPDLQVVYLPGVDSYTHVVDEPLRRQRGYLEAVLDPLVGDVLDEYRRQGVLERTYVVFVSDHGHTEVPADQRNVLTGEPAALLEGVGFRVRPFRIDVDRDDYQAVLAYQGSMAFVYLADRSTCAAPGTRCDWRRPPRHERDVLPVVRALHRAGRTGEAAPGLRGTIDLVLARPARRFWQGGPRPFQVWDGARLVPVEEYLRRNPRPDLLRFAERLAQLGSGPAGDRAGDVLVMPRTGPSVPMGERFYFGSGETYTSQHGSPGAEDSRIPLVVAHAALSGAELRRVVDPVMGRAPSQLQFAALVRALLRRP